MSAHVIDLSGYSRRVTPQQSDKSRKPEQVSRPLTRAEVADLYLAAHNRELQERQQREAQRLEEQRQRKQQEAEATQRQQAKAAFETNEAMLDQTIEMYGMTQQESEYIWDRMLATKSTNLEMCEMLCKETKLRRKQ